MFNFFKKSNVETNKEKEYITITNENGIQVEIEKNIWLDTTFKPYIDEHKDNIDAISDMIETAITYKIKEVIEYASAVYNIEQNNRTVNNLFKAYELNNMFNDAVELYQEYESLGYELTTYMYYDLAEIKEKLNDYDDLEKYLYLSFTKSNSNEKTTKKLMKYLYEKHSFKDYYAYLVDLNNNSHSWYLSKELAKLEYSMGENQLASSNIAKSINEAKKSEKKIFEIANILLDNKRYVEFENYILPLYSPAIKDPKFHNLVFKFYFFTKSYTKGLESLKEIYLNDIIDDSFSNSEKKLLKSKVYEEDYAKYGNIISCKDDANTKIEALKAPIYTNQLKIELNDRRQPKIIFLPISSDLAVGSFDDSIKLILRSTSSYIFDLVYNNSIIDFNNAFMYNTLGPAVKINDYDTDYLKKFKKVNEDLDYIITGCIKNVNGLEFDIILYAFDCIKNEKIILIERKVKTIEYKTFILELVNDTIPKMFDIEINEININDTNFIDIYAEYLDIFLNINRENKYKVHTADRIVRKMLEHPSEYRIKIALSTIVKLETVIPELKNKYKQKIYDTIIFNGLKDTNLEIFKSIYGEGNE